MAITQKAYSEYPHTKFPEDVDDHALRKDASGEDTNDTYALPYMTDIDADTMGAMNEYNEAFRNGQYTRCLTILDRENGSGGKKLKYSIFNADKFNWIRDSILALQKFFLIDVKAYINRVVDHNLGITITDISPNDPAADAMAYSAKYISIEFIATLKASDWKTTIGGGFSQTVDATHTFGTEITKITNENYTCYSSISAGSTPADVKQYNKAYAYLYNAITNDDGTVTFYAWKKPAIDFSVILKHV